MSSVESFLAAMRRLAGSPVARLFTTLFSILLLGAVVPAAGDDLLILKDGTQRRGNLTACVDADCYLSGAAVPFAQIAWMGFAPKTPTTPIVAADNTDLVVLRGGGQQSGRLVGVSLGVVTLDGIELDRGEVAWIRLAHSTAGSAHALPEGGPGPALDAITMRDGSVRLGNLVACAGGSCQLEGDGPLARSAIAAVFFGGGAASGSSSGTVGSEDLLTLRDGSAHKGPVFGLSPDDVVASSGTYERSSVASVLFAAEGTPATGGYGAPPDGPPAGEPQPPPMPSPGAPPPGPPPPPAAARRTPATTSPHWTGTVQSVYRYSDTYVSETVTSSVRIQAHEEVFSATAVDGKTVSQLIQLRSEELLFAESYSRQEHFEGGQHCDGNGEVRDSSGDSVGSMYLKNEDLDLTPFLGFDPPRDGGVYLLSPSAITLLPDYTANCRDANGSWTVEHSFMAPQIGRLPTNPWLTNSLVDPAVRHLESGRMHGSFEAVDGAGQFVAVSWSLCREGTDCPPPPALPPASTDDFDPCGRAGQEAALSDTCRAQMDALLAGLGPALAEYNTRTASAEANRGAFQESQNYCGLYDTAQDILEAILTGGTGPAAEAARALLYLRGVIDKAQSGDLGSMLYPDQVKEFLDYYKKAKALWFELTADQVAKMQRDHDACSGKVPIETYLKAKQFLTDLAAAKEIWDSKVAPGLNDLRAKGLECAYLAHKAWGACLADAACRGLPPDCGPEPSLAGVYDNP